ncbi:flavocytochrome c [Shewanella sp. 4t3-1-2LB]|uniref:flavocytochrome c n=1 Tax=Shewanella sp. 4t3-1-2LB TaxID=2817682 RepID=UPI001A99BED4|nr:flavocytochrome c [Shewanella sp. 4t3-1-2LB]MBO1271818.1 flavocytochrome c [Shewanella sp. 4t3-1-2LB]
MTHIKNATDISRRHFLKFSGAATATSGLLLAGLSTEAAAQNVSVPKHWDETFDVVVIGSGFAGLSAAIEARKAGANVIVLEKMPVPGGNSTINGGGMAAVGSDVQKAHGVKDSVDLMVADMYKAGLGLNYPQQARMVAEKSNEAFEWCRDYLGVKFKDTLAHFGGHAVPRTHTTTIQSGSGIVQPMLQKCDELGVQLQKKVYVKRLIVDGERVVGLEVIPNYRQGKEDASNTKFIKANKGVVMAAGGFAADVLYRTTQDPRLTAELDTTNHKGATAECLKELIRVGGNPVQLSWIQLGPWASPDEKGFGLAPIFAGYAAYPNGIMVDPQTGKRFVNELADRKIRADAIIKTGHPAIGICDEVGMQPAKHVMDKLLERGVVHKFDTLNELAAFYKIPEAELLAQAERYNRFVAQGKDSEFSKPFDMGQKTLGQAPFYGVRFWPKAHHTMGGIEIDTQARVVNIETRKPIPGLYAAGEITGGTHGACRLGTVAIPDCIVFGRIAGQQVVKA